MTKEDILLGVRAFIGTLIVAGTIYMMVAGVQIPEAWWPLATATVGYLFPLNKQKNGAA